MSILDKKKKIFGDIAAARTLTEGLPNLRTNSSFSSINNGGDSINFLTDLIKSLIGYGALVVAIVDVLTHSLAEIERKIKKALKIELKNIVSCGVDPSLPGFIKSSGTGIIIPVNKIDFLDLLKTDPNSIGGKLLYGDSSDFNKFLYGVIQNDGSPSTWAGIFDITFNSLGSGNIPNNTFTIKANSNYNTKTLTDLNNNFVDSLTLFNSQGIVNRIIDIIFGSISISIKKTTKQLETEAKINSIVDSMINTDAGDSIDDSFFTFTNEEIYSQQLDADLRKKGILKLECCNKVAASIPVSFLSDFNNEITGATTTAQKQEVISSNLNKMAEQNTINSNDPSDHISIKLNFIQQLINNLTKAIIGVVLSPKVIMIFMINYKIIYGSGANYNDAIDFIKKNKTLINSIIKNISSMVIKLLIVIALKRIAELVAAEAAVKQVERSKNQLSQLLSLVGVPQEVIRTIKGLA